MDVVAPTSALNNKLVLRWPEFSLWRSNLPHVANSSHASCAEAIDALTEVFNDRTSTATNSKVASKTQNDILGRSPVAQLANQVHTENLGGLEFPRSADKSLDSISATNTDGDMDACGNSRLGEVAGHELKNGHLGRSVLHVDTVGVEAQVGFATDVTSIVGIVEQRILRIVEMAVKDLLGKGQALLSENSAHIGILGVEFLVSRRKRLGGREVSPRGLIGGENDS
ncbi:hypothetical protein HG530_013422 [Fusarium avenaceum]|nr:hypothetical protein HG530_013422 [Fusarium avenaceum]